MIYFDLPAHRLPTGNVLSGTINLYMETARTLTIVSPTNTTYPFTSLPYILDLNVSADFNVSTWRYQLIDARHGHAVVYSNVVFTPNTSIAAVRWNNILTVSANDSSGETFNRTVYFFVDVPNSSPLLSNFGNQFICERNAFLKLVNASDVDEDTLVFDLSPKIPFFISSGTRFNDTGWRATFFSGNLTKSAVGNHSLVMSVTDSQYVDTKQFNITVIEINNGPGVGNIGVQTVYTQGDNATFYKQVQVNDIEDGVSSSGNFSFNLTFLSGTPFFGVSNVGVMNISPVSSQVGVYNLSLCVTDSAISSIHPNISLCGQTGLNRTVCQNFSLTVTNSNRAPTIVTYRPTNLTVLALASDTIEFNATTYDPDGTVADAYWLVDGNIVSVGSGSLYNGFYYSFGCGSSGNHNVTLRITDGLLNDSVTWGVELTPIDCPVFSPPSGGSSGGSGAVCNPTWACGEWALCQNTQTSLQTGVVTGSDFRLLSLLCQNRSYAPDICGYQLRSCTDLVGCNTTRDKPTQSQVCPYVLKPSCSDGVTNCHEGACELLVDCGGPCTACSTCSDGMQNQGEIGIDCGGPCPSLECTSEQPGIIGKKSYSFRIGLFILLFLIILLFILLVKIFRLTKLRKEFQGQTHAPQ